MAEFDISSVDFSPFIRPIYYSKQTEELLQEANTDGFAAYELGERYARNQDNLNALKYFKLAEQLGDKGAIYEIALLLHKMNRFREAAAYFEKAIELADNFEAYVYLAKYCLSGKLGLFKKKRGHKLLLTAAREGYAEAQFWVALTYLEGAGTSENIEEYVFWMRCAQRNGFSRAEEHMKVRMSDSRYTRVWEERIKKADKRLIQHDEYLAYERLVREIQQSEI